MSPWPWHRKTDAHVSAEAKAAQAAARQSLEQARSDRYRAERDAGQSREVREILREHNIANRYADWLEELVRGSGMHREEGGR